MSCNNRRLGTAILTAFTAAATALFFYGYKVYKEKQRLKIGILLKEEGNAYYKSKEYLMALEKYMCALPYIPVNNVEYMNILNNLSLTYMILRNYDEALMYTNKFLKCDKNNVKMLKRRHEIHKALEMPLESVCDAFIVGFLTNSESKNLGKNALESMVFRETEIILAQRKNLPSKINLEEYFDTFPDMYQFFEEYKTQMVERYENNDSIHVFSANYNMDISDSAHGSSFVGCRRQKLLYDDYIEIFYSDNTDSFTSFVKASMEHLQGNNELALSLIQDDDTFKYSVILKEYLTVLLNKRKISKEFLRFAQNNMDDLSVLFYTTLMYLHLYDMKYLEFLDIGVRKFPDLFNILKICNLIQNKEYDKTEEVLNNIRIETIALLSLSCEFYFLTKKLGYIPKLVEKMLEIDASDPRPYLFRAMLKEANDEDGVESEIMFCIEKDQTFIKPYLFLGDYLMKKNNKKCADYFELAKSKSCVREDVETAVKSLILLKVHDACMKEYPELFKQQ